MLAFVVADKISSRLHKPAELLLIQAQNVLDSFRAFFLEMLNL